MVTLEWGNSFSSSKKVFDILQVRFRNTIILMATLLLIIRNQMLEVIDSDFVLMARAKGLARHLVIFKHAGRNAIMAVAALSSPMIGFAVSSQLTVEQAFNWPGLGKLLVQSAASDDYPVLQATFLVLTVLVVFLNFVLDISYRYFSPSINIHRRL